MFVPFDEGTKYVVESNVEETQTCRNAHAGTRKVAFFSGETMWRNPIMSRDISEKCELVRTIVKPGAQAFMDSTKINTYRNGEVAARFTVPEDAVFDEMNVPNVGTIVHTRLYDGTPGATDVHFHGFVPAVGETYNVKATVYVREWYRCGPEGQDLDKGMQNCAYFIDLELSDLPSNRTLVVYDTSTPAYKQNAVRLFGRTCNDGIFADKWLHVAGNDRHKGDRDQHIALVHEVITVSEQTEGRRPRRPNHPTVIAEALARANVQVIASDSSNA